jgi:membrane-associated phospholipid phosphatase
MQIKLAKAVTDTLSPNWVAIMLLGGVSYSSSASLSDFAKWWLLSSLFLSILPWAFLIREIRRGKWDDIYLRQREQRIVPLLFTSASVIIGFSLLYFLGAPRLIEVVIGATIVGLIVSGITIRFWKLSVHTASIAGAVIITIMLLGMKAMPAIILVPLVGWARVKLAHHSLVEVVSGGIIGGVIGYGALSGGLAI